MEKQYLVFFDGYTGDRGAVFFLLGVYDTREKAVEAFENLIKNYPELDTFINHLNSIKEIELNNTLKVGPCEWTDWTDIIKSDVCLGGYIE